MSRFVQPVPPPADLYAAWGDEQVEVAARLWHEESAEDAYHPGLALLTGRREWAGEQRCRP